MNAVMVSGCRKNIMGTVSFAGKFPGMRKAQDFIVYPMPDSGSEIRIQSDNYFGRIDLKNGAGVLSARRAQYPNGFWLQQCVARGTAQLFRLSDHETFLLRTAVAETGGLLVGGHLKFDNTGAIALGGVL